MQTRFVSHTRFFAELSFRLTMAVGYITENERKPPPQVRQHILAMATESMTSMALGKPILSASLHEAMRHTACIFDSTGSKSASEQAASLAVAEEAANSLKKGDRRANSAPTLSTYWSHLMVAPATKPSFDAVRERTAAQAEFVAAGKLFEEVKSSVGGFNVLSMAGDTDFFEFQKQAGVVPSCVVICSTCFVGF